MLRVSLFDENWEEDVKQRASDKINRKAYSRRTCPIPALAPNITKPFSPELPGSHTAAKSLALRQNLTEI